MEGFFSVSVCLFSSDRAKTYKAVMRDLKMYFNWTCNACLSETLPFKLTEGSRSTPMSNGVPPLRWISYVL